MDNDFCKNVYTVIYFFEGVAEVPGACAFIERARIISVQNMEEREICILFPCTSRHSRVFLL